MCEAIKKRKTKRQEPFPALKKTIVPFLLWKVKAAPVPGLARLLGEKDPTLQAEKEGENRHKSDRKILLPTKEGERNQRAFCSREDVVLREKGGARLLRDG